MGISKAAAEKEDFHFICQDCKQKEEDAKKPKISLKFKVGTSSPAPPSPAPTQSRFVGVEIPRNDKNRPPSQGTTLNGTQNHQSSPPTLPVNSSHRPHPAQNGTFHHYSPPHLANSPPRPVYAAGQQARPASSSSQHSPNSMVYRNPAPPPSGYPLQQPHFSYYGSPNNTHATHSSPVLNHSLPYGTPQQNHITSAKLEPMAAAQNSTLQGQGPVNPHGTGNGTRLPSPVLNRPTMSPTQGNMDVGPVAGIPQKPSGHNQSTNGNAHVLNGGPQYAQATPRPPSNPSSAQTPNTLPLSGLSPKKQQTPVSFPTPLTVQKAGGFSTPLGTSPHTTLNASTSSGTPQVQKRSVSGTPILPPVENLRPSPEQMRNMSSNEPVPTPSKHSPPQTLYNTESVRASPGNQKSQEIPPMAPAGLGISPPPQIVGSSAERKS